MQVKSTSKPRAKSTPTTNKTAHFFKSPQAQTQCRRIIAVSRSQRRELAAPEWLAIFHLLSEQGRSVITEVLSAPDIKETIARVLGGLL